MMKIISKDTWIVCPKSNVKIQIHACVTDKCKYEAGHTISYDGSEVNCMYGETKQIKLNFGEK